MPKLGKKREKSKTYENEQKLFIDLYLQSKNLFDRLCRFLDHLLDLSVIFL